MGLDVTEVGGGRRAGTSAGADPALTSHLTDSLAAVLPAIEQFLRFEGADQATRRSAWLPALD